MDAEPRATSAPSLTPGQGHRYPLLHYVVLGLLVSPVLLIDLVMSTMTRTSLAYVVVSVPSMTAIAVITKLTHITMMSLALFAPARESSKCMGSRDDRFGYCNAVMARLP